jgi:hypothetical protein
MWAKMVGNIKNSLDKIKKRIYCKITITWRNNNGR